MRGFGRSDYTHVYTVLLLSSVVCVVCIIRYIPACDITTRRFVTYFNRGARVRAVTFQEVPGTFTGPWGVLGSDYGRAKFRGTSQKRKSTQARNSARGQSGALSRLAPLHAARRVDGARQRLVRGERVHLEPLHEFRRAGALRACNIPSPAAHLATAVCAGRVAHPWSAAAVCASQVGSFPS